MDILERKALIDLARAELKQRVDMTARPPSRQYTPSELRVQRDIVRTHPLDRQEAIAAGKLRTTGMRPYDAYWGIRNNRYDAQGNYRRRKPSRVASFRTITQTPGD